jgi:ABC-type cobalamin/Fe3+-siderophores transport system ATPase subunit
VWLKSKRRAKYSVKSHDVKIDVNMGPVGSCVVSESHNKQTTQTILTTHKLNNILKLKKSIFFLIEHNYTATSTACLIQSTISQNFHLDIYNVLDIYKSHTIAHQSR